MDKKLNRWNRSNRSFTEGHLGENNKYPTSDLVISMQTTLPKKVLILLSLQVYMQVFLCEDQNQTISLHVVFHQLEKLLLFFL